jgi:exonuclease VII small subunit|tara:strand:+ start:219 stop:356 length:138 start_codon:yes stop_codon:yes gene_type:complete
MVHNYNHLLVPYYRDRIEALERYVKKLEFENAQLEVELNNYKEYE